MRIAGISSVNYKNYSADKQRDLNNGRKTVSMCGKREDERAIRKLENFMIDNDIMMRAEIIPVFKNESPHVKLSLETYHFYDDKKESSKKPIPLIRRGYKKPIEIVESMGGSIQEAELKLIKYFGGSELSIIGEPMYKVKMPDLKK